MKKNLLIKKTEFKEKGLTLINKGKSNIKIILLTGTLTIRRSVLRIKDDINLEQYNLNSKNIIPLDEYLLIDKLQFKVSVKAMIEIAFWGQNQPSFKRIKEILKRNNIDISISNIRKITEYIGKIVYNYEHKKSYKIWDERANLNPDSNKKEGILFLEIDGASVNTRIEDKNGSTWKENKLAIFFSKKDMYIRKNGANIIEHKDFVTFVGSVDIFKILVFAKMVELKYWEYKNIVFISDGATWLRNMINELFPEAKQILDKFHLIENIYEYAKFIFNDDIKQAEKFKDKIIGYCYSREYNLIKKTLDKYRDIKLPDNICNLPIYLENNKDKIDYSTYENNNWLVGSGAIESSNKTIVHLRLKQAGMRWSVEGANYLLQLRNYAESKKWDKIEKIVIDYIFG